MKPRASSFAFVVLVFGLLCLPLLLSTRTGGYADDEDLYYLPAVHQIRAHWPALDLNRDALSAVSPGYPYLLTTLSLVTGPGRLTLRLATWGLSLALLALLWRLFPVATGALGTAAVLPLACSNFFVKSASWIVTDNPALLCAAGALAAAFLRRDARGAWLGGFAAGGATFLRQVQVWTTAPLALRAMVGFRAHDGSKPGLPALIAPLIPLVVLGLLVAKWHGLVPLRWQSAIALQGALTATPLCYLLAVFFLLGIFYHLALPDEVAGADGRGRATWIAAAIGLALVLMSPTDYDRSAGRWGGYLWSAAAHLPVLAQRSILFVILVPAGAALLAVMTRRLFRQAGSDLGWLWLGSFLAWTATALSNRLVFHRYYEPTILVFLIFWILLMIRGRSAPTAFRPARLYALALGQGLITLATAHYQTYGASFLTGR